MSFGSLYYQTRNVTIRYEDSWISIFNTRFNITCTFLNGKGFASVSKSFFLFSDLLLRSIRFAVDTICLLYLCQVFWTAVFFLTYFQLVNAGMASILINIYINCLLPAKQFLYFYMVRYFKVICVYTIILYIHLSCVCVYSIEHAHVHMYTHATVLCGGQRTTCVWGGSFLPPKIS